MMRRHFELRSSRHADGHATRVPGPAIALLLALAIALSFVPCSVAAQEVQDVPTEEVVVNFAAGRVVIAVVKDAIIIATVENKIETGTHPPIPVQLSSRRAGIILGAVDWFSPSSQLQLARLDSELPHLHGHFAVQGPHLNQVQVQTTGEASDIEALGQDLFERMNVVVNNLHGKLDWPPAEPVAELILTDYIEGYGPEIWQLNFTLTQEMQRIDFYDTHVSHPTYQQFWPPEKGQPHTLVEFQYPPENPTPTLLDLLRRHDPRLEKICASDQKMREVADRFLNGESNKAPAADATQFLRAALDVLTPPSARQTMAVIHFDAGFEWILRPPLEPRKYKTPAQQERPADAPSLLNGSSPD
ncbi:MAG: hypothetical protein WA192_20035 [Candidatus Acidiferrales bacterium]